MRYLTVGKELFRCSPVEAARGGDAQKVKVDDVLAVSSIVYAFYLIRGRMAGSLVVFMVARSSPSVGKEWLVLLGQWQAPTACAACSTTPEEKGRGKEMRD